MKIIFLVLIFTTSFLQAQTVEQEREFTYNKRGELVIANHSNGTQETYTIDNVHNITRWERIAQVADLAVLNASATPSVSQAGGRISVRFTNRNIGRLAASGHRYRIFYSENNLLDNDDIPLYAESLGSLSPNSEFALTATVTIPSGATAGNRYLIVLTDSEQQIIEADEENNNKAISFTCILSLNS